MSDALDDVAGGLTTSAEASPDGEPPDARPSARLITIVIVFTTLSVATVGYLANRASTRSTSAADNAGQLGLAASRDLQTERQQAQSDYFAYLVGEANNIAGRRHFGSPP